MNLLQNRNFAAISWRKILIGHLFFGSLRSKLTDIGFCPYSLTPLPKSFCRTHHSLAKNNWVNVQICRKESTPSIQYGLTWYRKNRNESNEKHTHREQRTQKPKFQFAGMVTENNFHNAIKKRSQAANRTIISTEWMLSVVYLVLISLFSFISLLFSIGIPIQRVTYIKPRGIPFFPSIRLWCVSVAIYRF